MPWRALLKTLFAISVPLGAYMSLLLVHEYILALSGKQEPEWQIAFETAPIPMILGLLSLAAALVARPRFPAVSIAICAGIVVLPALLYLLVAFQAY